MLCKKQPQSEDSWQESIKDRPADHNEVNVVYWEKIARCSSHETELSQGAHFLMDSSPPLQWQTERVAYQPDAGSMNSFTVPTAAKELDTQAHLPRSAAQEHHLVAAGKSCPQVEKLKSSARFEQGKTKPGKKIKLKAQIKKHIADFF